MAKRATRVTAPQRAGAVEALERRVLLSVAAQSAVMGPLKADDADANVVSVQWKGQQAQARQGQFILRLEAGGARAADQVRRVESKIRLKRKDVRVKNHLGGNNSIVLIDAPANVTAGELEKSFRKLSGFRYVEPNFVYTVDATPNDPRYNELYGLHNIGQSSGTADADIDAPEAWDITRGDGSAVVGVIDTGVKYDHPDLAANIWVNSAEVPGNNVDDDANGFIDDIHGWDFVGAGDDDPMDDHGHGTHCAGTIAAVGNNGVGVAGVNWDAKVMALKFLSASGSGSTDDAVEAINYATMMKGRGVNVRITSNSWGGGGFSQALADSIAASNNAGMLFIAAAGNSNSNNDVSANYPSNYDVPNVIAVAATDRRDAKAGFSSYGATTVDLGAPGVDILSTSLSAGGSISDPSGYIAISGTSMATPHVAGVAALAFSISPTATIQQVRDAILDGGDPIPSMAGITVTGKRLNAFGAMQRMGLVVATTTPPAGGIVTAPPVDFVVNFSNAVVADTANPAGVQAGDFRVNGLAANSVVLNDADTATFHFNASPVTAQGEQTMAMPAGSVLRASDNNPLREFDATFRYDALRMQVVSTVPAVGSVVTLPLTSLRVVFNEDVVAGTLGADDLVLSQGTVTGFTRVDARTVDYTLAGIVDETTLTVVVPAGRVTDGFGNPNEAFTGTYNLDRGTVPYPGEFVPRGPVGAWVYDSAAPVPGNLGFAGDTDRFTLLLDANQSLTVVVDPAAGVQPAIQLLNPAAAVIGNASAAAAGSDALLQTARITAGGLYTIVVGGAGTGAYTVRALLNAADESERHNGPNNDARTPAGSESLDAGFVPLLATGGPARRTAVLGNSTSNDDYFGFVLNSGQSVSLLATKLGGAGAIATLELFDSANRLAASTGNSTAERAVDHFIAPASGRYYVRVEGNSAGVEYALAVAVDAAIDRGANDTNPTAQALAGRAAALGRVSSGAGPITTESEPNDDGIPGGSAADVALADDWSGDFALSGPGQYTAVVAGTISAGNDGDWDFFKFFARPGDALRLFNDGTTLHDAYLRLYDNTGRELATNDDGGGNLDSLINYNAFAYAGDYYAVADSFGSDTGAYTLTATLTTTQLTGSIDADTYSFVAAGGDVLRLATATPADGPGEFDNTLNPLLELYGPTGALLASNDNGGPDGRNALVNHVAGSTGTYSARVRTSAGTSGEYVLSLSGNSVTGPGARPPFAVTATTPPDNATVGPLTQYTLDFNDAVLLSSLQPSDFLIDGGAFATGFAAPDGDTVSIFLPASAQAQGLHTVAIAAGAVADTQGTPVAAFTGRYTVDATGPRVLNSSVQEGATLPTGTLVYTARFSEPIIAAVNDDDFALVGATTGLQEPVSFDYAPASRVLTLRFTNLAEDAYTLTLLSGDGRFEDVVGNDLDGEPAWPLPAAGSGNGAPGGNFFVRFNVDAGPRALPAFQARQPYGSLVYEGGSFGALINAAGDADDFTVNLDAGQLVTVVVDAAAAGALRPSLSLFDPSGALVTSVSAAAVGQDAVLQARPAAAAGVYRIEAGGAAGTAGGYNVRVLLNAVAEAESYGGPNNDTRLAAQDLSPALTSLNGGANATGPRRAAAAGSLPPAAGAPVFSDGFETGALGPAWSTYSSLPSGRVDVTEDFGAAGGTFAVWMDTGSDGEDTLNELVWTVNLAGVAQPRLNFAHAEYGDEETAMPVSPFVGHVPGDGIAFSGDGGTTWHPLWTAPDQQDETFQTYNLDLAAAAAEAGVTPGANFKIKFQQYDNFELISDGRGWDSVSVSTPAANADWYSLPLAAGEALTVAVGDQTGGSAVGVDLFDPAGNLVASGLAGARNLGRVIDLYSAPAAGTYSVRVTGNDADYTLLAAAGAAFDQEPNDAAASAPNLSGRSVAFGRVGNSGATAAGAASAQSSDPGVNIALPVVLTDGGAFRWDIDPDGSIGDGSNDAYDGGMNLFGFGDFPTANTEDNGREIVIGDTTLSGVRLTRKVYVPPDQGYARFLEIVHNTTAAPANFSVDVITNLGSDGNEVVVRTSSGDSLFTVSDDWIVTDDADGSSDPTLLHVVAGPGAPMRPGTVSKPSGGLSYTYPLTLAPGQTKIVMHFASQNPNRAAALPKGPQLAALGLGAVNGMSAAELDQVVNFSLSNPDDFYRRTFAAGELVTFRTLTPSDGPGEFSNTLNPSLSIFGPAGNLLASNDNGSSDGRNAVLSFTAPAAGTYAVRVSAAPNTGGDYVLESFASPAAVAGRHVFYNNSGFDTGAGRSDDTAVAADKRALLPGQTATFANYTSYSKGLNGVMIDVSGLPANVTLDAANDFAFKVGNSNTAGAWPAANPPTVTLRRGAGAVAGSDRITLTWPDGAIKGQWLQVAVKATPRTGLAKDDVFYFGNAVGEAGNSTLNAQVTSADEMAARAHAGSNVALISRWDFNRDRRVNVADQLLARTNKTTAGTALQLITAPGASALRAAPMPAGASPGYRPLNLFFESQVAGPDGADDADAPQA